MCWIMLNILEHEVSNIITFRLKEKEYDIKNIKQMWIWIIIKSQAN